MQDFVLMMFVIIGAFAFGYAMWFLSLIFKVAKENGHLKELKLSTWGVLKALGGLIVAGTWAAVVTVPILLAYLPPYYISRAHNIRHSAHRATV